MITKTNFLLVDCGKEKRLKYERKIIEAYVMKVLGCESVTAYDRYFTASRV